MGGSADEDRGTEGRGPEPGGSEANAAPRGEPRSRQEGPYWPRRSRHDADPSGAGGGKAVTLCRLSPTSADTAFPCDENLAGLCALRRLSVSPMGPLSSPRARRSPVRGRLGLGPRAALQVGVRSKGRRWPSRTCSPVSGKLRTHRSKDTLAPSSWFSRNVPEQGSHLRASLGHLGRRRTAWGPT